MHLCYKGLGQMQTKKKWHILLATFLSIGLSNIIIGPPFSASAASRCPDLLYRSERFHMPLIYERDVEWAAIMQESVEAGVAIVNEKPSTTFQEIIETMISAARPKLVSRAHRFPGDKGRDNKIEHHAGDFGVPRGGSRRWTPLIGKLEVFKKLAIESLKRFGTYYEVSGRWGPFSSHSGQPYTEVIYSLQATYETPFGSVKLCEVKSSWIPSNENEDVRNPWNSVDIYSPEADVSKSMLEAADLLFEKVKQLKTAVDRKQIGRDQSLEQTISYASEIYWIVSQAWPYRRGSASIADLSSKVIFDWMGIKTPLWREDANPNILALIYPLRKFQEVYRYQHQSEFTWIVPD